MVMRHQNRADSRDPDVREPVEHISASEIDQDGLGAIFHDIDLACVPVQIELIR